jgi:SAM-dependent methyltransferase
MDATHKTSDEQTKRWNGPAGCAWVDAQELLDRLYEPFEKMLVDAASARSASRVLDVGCGSGGTTVAVARQLGVKGHCTGIDISEPMIAAARARAERDHTPATFIVADAQAFAFEPASFDLIMSRFGVMFFSDPVHAFVNLRRAAADEADLRCIAWRSPDENGFMTMAERVAGPLVPDLPIRQPDEPGQFGLATGDRVARILKDSGWTAIDLQPIDVTCTMPEPELVRYIARFGPVGLALQGVDEETRTRIAETIRPAFDPFVHGADVRFTAACWMIAARARATTAIPETGSATA